MRDHLLGCQAFLPPEPHEHCNTSRAKPFALGIPARVKLENVERQRAMYQSESAFDVFENTDHTPAGMMVDFPREYDLTTMLREAAGRLMFPHHKGMLVPEEYEALSRSYDAELQRLCGLSLAPEGVKFGKLTVEFK